MTNVESWRLAYAAVAENMQRVQLKSTSSSQNGVLLELDPVYSPGQRSKKYEIIIMSHLSRSTGSPEATEMLEMCCITCRRVCFTYPVEGSCFVYQWNWNHRQISSDHWLVSQGSLAPRPTSIYSINHMAYSTAQEHT